jgi:hypothetical protein
MKLFRLAFWLGVVIYNLPSPVSEPSAPESRVNGSQTLAAKAAPGQSCPRQLVTCAKIVEAPQRGEPSGRNSWRDAVKSSQDTLASADRGVSWRGPALRSRDPAGHGVGL